MTEPLTPQSIEMLAAGYVIGDLDRAEAERFEQLLAEDPALVAEVHRLQLTLDQVAYDLNSVEPPPYLESKILAAATANPQLSQRKKSKVSWKAIVGGVATLLILYLGVDNYRLRQDRLVAQDIKALLQQPQTQLFSLKAVNANASTAGSFVVNLKQRQGILALENLAAPPTGKVYRLWAIADGEKIPCGTLKHSAKGTVTEKFWMPADFYDTGITGLFVTLEVSESSRYPTGPTVIQSKLSTQI
jgi:anti-sigma-K factor RskA